MQPLGNPVQKLGTFTINEIHCGDSAVLLKQLPAECIDLTVTSPPYDNLRTYNGFTFDFETIAKELFRVTKSGGVVVWVVGDATINGSETLTSFRQAIRFQEIGFNVHDTMIWNKESTAVYDPRNKRCKSVFEYMFVFSKGTPNTYNEILDVPVKKAGKKNTSGTRRKIDGSMRLYRDYVSKNFQARSNVWIYKTGNNISTKDKIAMAHPAIFPEYLAYDHIYTWSNEGEIVLDCFSGSGTTLKMAKLLKRRYIGFEISDEYCSLAKQRLNGRKVAQQSVHLTAFGDGGLAQIPLQASLFAEDLPAKHGGR